MPSSPRRLSLARRFARMPWYDLLMVMVVMGGLTWLILRGAGTLSYNWQWYRVPRYLYTLEDGRFVPGPLLDGLWVTFHITGVSLLLASAVGLTTAFLRLSGSVLGRAVGRVYLELARNTPLLVQIFFIYFVLGPVLDIGRFASAVMALTLFEGAYASEIFRAGIISISAGQWEAARSLGMTTAAAYRHVILPQAIRRVVPPLTGQAVSLVKDSALVSTIAIYDLTMQGQAIIAETYLTFELWLTVAGIYLVVTASLSGVAYLLERRFPGATGGS